MLVSKFKKLLAAIILLIVFSAGHITGDSGYRENVGQSNPFDDELRPESFKHIILTWQDDPKHSQAVTWRTDVKLNQAIAEIAISYPTPDFGNSAKKYQAKTSTLNTDEGLKYYHSFNFTNLLPDTIYAYRIGNGEVWSEWFQFRTAADKPADFSFIYLGDAQNEIHSLWSRTIRAAVIEAPKARFIIHAGDMVNRPDSDRQWDDRFKAGGWIFAMFPSIPVVGNHEYSKRDSGRPSLSKYWKTQFALPEIGPKDLANLDGTGSRKHPTFSSNLHFRQYP